MKIQKIIIIILALCFSGNAFSKQKNVSSEKTKPSKENSEAVKELKPAPLPAHDMGDDWLGVRLADEVSTYKLKSKPKIIGTFHLRKQDKKMDLKQIGSKDFFKEFVQSKEEWLMMIGIREWKIDSHDIKDRKDFKELNASGSYKRANGEKVFFEERQFFFSDSVYQILVISPKKKDLQSESVSKFFKKAQEIGLSQKESQKNKKISQYSIDAKRYI